MVLKPRIAFSPSNSRAKPMLLALKITLSMTKLGVPQKSIPQELLLNKNGEIVTQVVQIPTIQMDFVEAKIFSMTMADVFKDTKWNPNYKSKLSGTKSMRIMGKIIMQQINVLGPELPRNVNVN